MGSASGQRRYPLLLAALGVRPLRTGDIRKGEAPSAEDLAAAPLLQFWCLIVDEPFAALQGVVTGHPLIPDRHMIATSPLLWIAPDRSAARTVSRWYRLGAPLTGATTTPQ